MQNRAHQQKAFWVAREKSSRVGLSHGNGGAALTICAHNKDAFRMRADTYQRKDTGCSRAVLSFLLKRKRIANKSLVRNEVDEGRSKYILQSSNNTLGTM